MPFSRRLLMGCNPDRSAKTFWQIAPIYYDKTPGIGQPVKRWRSSNNQAYWHLFGIQNLDFLNSTSLFSRSRRWVQLIKFGGACNRNALQKPAPSSALLVWFFFEERMRERQLPKKAPEKYRTGKRETPKGEHCTRRPEPEQSSAVCSTSRTN